MRKNKRVKNENNFVREEILQNIENDRGAKLTGLDEFRLFSKEETDEIIRQYMEKAEDYSPRISNSGIVWLFLKNESAVIANPDGTVTWFARAISFPTHAFIELRTGEKDLKTIYLPICLVNDRSRKFAEVLLNSTIKKNDTRFCGKDAELVIMTPDGKICVIQLELKSLALSYVAFQMFPQFFMVRSKSPYCPFCKEAFGQPSGDDNNE